MVEIGWRAAQAAGLESIDCFFHEGELSESELREQQLVENLLREDLRPMEQARAFASLMELNGWNGKQLAQSLHIAESNVSRSLALLDLPEDVQRQVDSGELAARSAYELSRLPSEEQQRTLARMMHESQRKGAFERMLCQVWLNRTFYGARRLDGESTRCQSGVARFLGRQAGRDRSGGRAVDVRCGVAADAAMG